MNMKLCFGKYNFIVMGVAALMILIGFCMTGGEPSTPEHFNPDVFSDTRVVYGPNLCFLGYLVMFVGIMIPNKKNK